MTHNEHEEGSLLSYLDTKNLAIGVAVVAYLILGIFAIKLYDDLRHTVDRLDREVARRDSTVMKLDRLVEARLQDTKASDEAAVSRCFQTATQGPVLRRVLLALEREAQSPQAKRDLLEFVRLSELNSPSIHECRKLAKELKVTPLEGAEG